MRISDWSSDVCSSDLALADVEPAREIRLRCAAIGQRAQGFGALMGGEHWRASHMLSARHGAGAPLPCPRNDQLALKLGQRSEEHTSELQSLMRISYAVFCLNKKNKDTCETSQYHNIQQNPLVYTSAIQLMTLTYIHF